jgi:HD superfamily phosphohydrolase
MPAYEMQVRDLVHGYIGFSALEKQVVDHPLFQRLRNVRQADVAHFVYPSSNISRFEHALGTCHVAGAMARNLSQSPNWNEKYLPALKAKTGIGTVDQFVETVRLYALLHDIGHLPLSHLFERALENYVQSQPHGSLEALVKEWFGESDFAKPHEDSNLRYNTNREENRCLRTWSTEAEGLIIQIRSLTKTLERSSWNENILISKSKR